MAGEFNSSEQPCVSYSNPRIHNALVRRRRMFVSLHMRASLRGAARWCHRARKVFDSLVIQATPAPKQSPYNEMQDHEACYRCDEMQTCMDGWLRLLIQRTTCSASGANTPASRVHSIAQCACLCALFFIAGGLLRQARAQCQRSCLAMTHACWVWNLAPAEGGRLFAYTRIVD